MTPEAFAAIQARFDRYLERGGFDDIEGGSDLNDMPASTFRGGTVALVGDAPAQSDALTFAISRYWTILSQLAETLPRTYRHRRFILLATELGSVNAAAVRCGFGAQSWRAARVFRQFLFEKGLVASPFIPKRSGWKSEQGTRAHDRPRRMA